jgi:hypothetical protein
MERMTTSQIDEISAAVVASESARFSPEDIQEEEETERLEEERLAQEEADAEEEELGSPMDPEDEVGREHNIERVRKHRSYEYIAWKKPPEWRFFHLNFEPRPVAIDQAVPLAWWSAVVKHDCSGKKNPADCIKTIIGIFRTAQVNVSKAFDSRT